MTIKKIHSSYQTYISQKIQELESTIASLEQSLNDNTPYHLWHLWPIVINDWQTQAKQKIEQTKEEIEKLHIELPEKLAASQYEPTAFFAPWHSVKVKGTEVRERWLYVYQDVIYENSNALNTNEEVKLLILDFVDKERRKFEQLKNKFSGKQPDNLEYERTRIPESVRIAVWRRDQGKCARCGNRENMEYDHIVPVSKGGSNTERNIELLCQNCNRSKSNRIQ